MRGQEQFNNRERQIADLEFLPMQVCFSAGAFGWLRLEFLQMLAYFLWKDYCIVLGTRGLI